MGNDRGKFREVVVMNLLSLPETSARSEDDLDELLRGFFKAEMPDPWPNFQGPPVTLPLAARSRPTGRSVLRSRLALAASVALLLAGPLLLSGRLAQSAPDSGRGIQEGTATRPTIPEEPKKVEPLKSIEGDGKFHFDEFLEVGPDGQTIPKVTGRQPE